MLFKPVYLKRPSVTIMKQPLIKMGQPAQNPPTPPPTPPPLVEPEPVPQLPKEEPHLPLLISGPGVDLVVPPEARRDVLAGRVDYYLADASGVTLFRAKHIFAALKLEKEKQHRYEDYICIGAHQRVLQRQGKPRVGLGYRRRFISPDLIKRGIYGD